MSCYGCNPAYSWSAYSVTKCYTVTATTATAPTTPLNPLSGRTGIYGVYGAKFYDLGFPIAGNGAVLTTSTTPFIWASTGSCNSSTGISTIGGGAQNRTFKWVGQSLYNCYSNKTPSEPPFFTWVGFSVCLSGLPESKTYYFGVAADNDFQVYLDGILILDSSYGGISPNTSKFTYWHVYPINLLSGNHTLELYGYNIDQIGAFGCEIYNNTFSQLTGATTVNDLNIIFSSSGQTNANVVRIGDTYSTSGYTCPPGYVYSTCDGCVKYTFCNVLPEPPSPSPSSTMTPTPTNTPAVTPTPTNTPTPSITPTMTRTPNPTPSLPPNECNVLTLFPLGVECSKVNPICNRDDGSMTISITGGTPPYKIYWSTNQIGGYTIFPLSAGTYSALVTDNYGDFSATSICTLEEITPNCENNNLIVNGNFSAATDSWDISPASYSWIWSSGVAQYNGGNTSGIISQSNILTIGKTYNINFILNKEIIPDDGNTSFIIVSAGTSSYGPITDVGVTNVSTTLICLNNTDFSIYAYDEGTSGSYNILTIDDVCVYESCNTIPLVTNNFDSTPQSLSITYTELYELCMTLKYINQYGVYTNEQLFFVPSTDIDGNPTWTTLDLTTSIVLDTTYNIWTVVFDTPQVFDIQTSNSNYPPTDNWYMLGLYGSVGVITGSCTTQSSYSMSISLNQTICGCDGSITITPTGGYPPYQYSIDSGVTFKTLPLFNNLCSGIYSVKMIDSSGDTTSQTVTLDLPSNQTVYTVLLNTTSTTTVNTNTSLTKTYTTTVSVTPALPSGVTITFDLIHTNNFYSSPTDVSATGLTNSDLFVNNIVVPITYSSTTTGTTTNIIPGCQLQYVYYSSLTENWNSIGLTSSDDIEVITTTTVNKNDNSVCYVGDSNEIYSISNLNISGCYCCTVIGLG